MKKKILLLFIALITVSLLVFSACNTPENDDGDFYDCTLGIHNYTVKNKCAICNDVWEYSEGLELVLSNDKTYYSVVGIGSCTDTKLILPNGYKGKPVSSIGDYAFHNCTGLTNITISNSVTNVGTGVFSGCTGLTSIVIPNNVTSVGYEMFSFCTGLTSVTIADGVTNIDTCAFYKCTGLMSITIPDSVTSIGNSAFASCDGLTSVTIGDNVMSIGNGAFSGCKKLTSVTIGDSVTSIGSSAFFNCTKLTSINYRDTEEEWNTILKGASWDCYHNSYSKLNYTITYNYTGE